MTAEKPTSLSSNSASGDDSSVNSPGFVDRIVRLYGDMIYDLCESILWNPSRTQVVFRSVLKRVIKPKRGASDFKHYERPWILRAACEELLALAPAHSRKFTAAEQIQLDSAQNVSTRLKQFDHYFHRLPLEDQVLLLFKDKYGLPYSEIAIAMNVPEGSLKMRRSQALRTLEEWVWGSA